MSGRRRGTTLILIEGEFPHNSILAWLAMAIGWPVSVVCERRGSSSDGRRVALGGFAGVRRRSQQRWRRFKHIFMVEPGEIEAEFSRLGTELVLRKFFSYRTPGPLFFPKSGWGSPDDEVPLPSWITEEDLKYYTSKFEKTGFTGGLNYYRALNQTWELTSPWTLAKINVPVKFIIGDLDLTYHYPSIQEFIHKGGFKKFAPFLDDVIVVMKDVGHFINEEKPNEVSEHIINFIKKFT